MFNFFNRRAVILAGLAGTLAAPVFSAQAQTAVQISGAAPPFSSAIRVLGPADPAATLHVQVALRLRDAKGLAARAQAGAHLGFAELDQHYLPLQSDHDAVIAWLQGQGLTIDQTHDSRLTIGVSGDAEALSRAFGITFSRILSEGQNFTATDETPSVPAYLAGVILSVNGLQPQLHAKRLFVKSAAAATPGYTPADFIIAYHATSLGLKGAGTTTAIVIDTFPQTSDLTTFWKTTGTPQKLANVTFIQVNPGTLPYLSGEETLDTEITSSIAPASKVRVYASVSLAFPLIDNDFQAIISDIKTGVHITEVSISLGACETEIGLSQAQTDDQFFSVIQSLGASIFVASGDGGSYECGGFTSVPSFYSTSPNVTAVGGTTLNLSSAGARNSEIAWDASGGGESTIFDQPTYQAKLTNYTVRTVPDVAADANPLTGAYIVLYGNGQAVGGTSLSAPLWAGMTALINATRLSDSKTTIGAINRYLYTLPEKKDFYDIKLGSNGAYNAGPGYDLVTGLGTPDMAALLPALTAKP